MIYYFDSSALAERYLLREGSKQIQELISGADYIETSALTELELTTLFENAKNEHRLNSPNYRKVTAYLQRDIRTGVISLVNMDKETWLKAKRIIQQRRLDFPAAIQLATAVGTNKRFQGDIQFVSGDRELLQAAKLERLQCVLI